MAGILFSLFVLVGFSFAADMDADGYPDSVDCNDHDSTVNPGATEICDLQDNDCDGLIDEYPCGASSDADGDGFLSVLAGGTDCDDTDPGIHPGSPENCDGLDNDCDGAVDNGCDLDGDGYDATLDCDDLNSAINPGAVEVCDTIDNDCNSQVDDKAIDATAFYPDVDGDGYGNSSFVEMACAKPAGYVADNTDCDDTSADINPSISELCDSIDNNCDGTVDEGCLTDTGDSGTLVTPGIIEEKGCSGTNSAFLFALPFGFFGMRRKL